MANGTSIPHTDSTSPMSTVESLTTEQTNDKTLETTMSQITLNTPTTNTPLFVSELCRNHTNATGEAISRRELWALANNTSQWLPEHLNRISFGPIYNAFPAVDTFFALSGLLLTYLMMKELKTNNGKLNWPMFYFHRFWRLTPPYMLILMVYVSLFPYIGEGPGWPKDGAEVNYCEHSWHRNFLYVNNLFVDGYDMCMAWSWYLANDMQFYVISPLILLPLFHYHLVGVAILLAFLLGSTIACGLLSAHDDLPASMFDGGNSQKFFNEYVKPWNRITPYLIGIYVGYLLYKTDCKVRINRFVNIFAWLAFTAVACTVLYGLHKDVTGDRLSTDVAALYTATHRMVWGACVCWVIFACATGNGGIINTILSWKVFVPLSRLTYCAYLVHPIVIYYYLLRRQRLIHFSDTEVTYEFLGHVVLSYAVALVASLVFESPMMGLEKALLKRKERKDEIVNVKVTERLTKLGRDSNY
ncbi:nose resistant to fluoxetine protein 6-like [Mytilus californianus]|uniref:nose resistant to fluoxetine protein 6-like n=1 Tax=Mytilus californianus TaxID=6549 RepID=UPI0022461E4E|nr:nose resistant to fluoxetine protein 6-like [Mytilus californianus]